MDRDILTVLGGLEGLRHLKPASEEEVAAAEQALGLKFAGDYRAYVLHYGAVSARGVELTGVTESKRLSVVAVTQAERERNQIPDEMYVIESAAIDGIILLQNSAGEIFSAAPQTPLKRVCGSLAEYVAPQTE